MGQIIIICCGGVLMLIGAVSYGIMLAKDIASDARLRSPKPNKKKRRRY